jgi:hypothetical protein
VTALVHLAKTFTAGASTEAAVRVL